MQYDYSKLTGRIIERFGTRKAFARAMGWSERTLTLKLNNYVAWTQADIEKALKLLRLAKKDIQSFFFTKKV